MKKILIVMSLSGAVLVCEAHENNRASAGFLDTPVARFQPLLNQKPVSLVNHRQLALAEDLDPHMVALQDQIDADPMVPHPVGSCYGGGVVYYVNPDLNAPAGQRGLIVAPSDSNGTSDGTTLINGCTIGNPAVCKWDTTGFGFVAKTAKAFFSGDQNTLDIIGTTTTGTWSAAQAATGYNIVNPASACTGCTNWYLPSQDELATLYYQTANITFPIVCPDYTYTPLVATAYWSSTQINPDIAWLVSFNDGFVSSLGTTNPLAVRPVRAF